MAINIALGDNGLFQRSKEAVNTWKSAEENETGVLDYLDREWYNLINSGSTGNLPTEPEDPELPIGPILTGDTVDDIILPENSEDPTIVTIGGEEVTIPPKFTIAEDSGKTVPEGIAVVDPQGNEWVWIPCYVEGGKGSNIAGRLEYSRTAFHGENITSIYTETLSTISAEYQSISQYGGYYLGRYEAGDKDLSELETPRLRISSEGINHKVSIKKNQVPYNWVTQAQCVALSEEMTSAEGTDSNKLDGRKVITKLCSSYSWDTALMFIQKTHKTYGSDSKTNEGTLVDNITDNGSNNKLANTGLKGSVCSIYDMGGNLYEYTTESCNDETYPYVISGGSYDDGPSYSPAGFRGNSDGNARICDGFRPTLFVK